MKSEVILILLLNVQIIDYNTHYQLNPVSDNFTEGGYVVCWEDSAQDTSNYGVFAQVFISNGDKYGSTIAVNKTTTNNQSHPCVACTKKKNSSDFTIVWASEVSSGSYDIYANIFENRVHKKKADILGFYYKLKDNHEKIINYFNDYEIYLSKTPLKSFTKV